MAEESERSSRVWRGSAAGSKDGRRSVTEEERPSREGGFTPEVAGYEGTLIDAIEEGLVEPPPLCEWMITDPLDPEAVSWLTWRRDEGQRPRLRTPLPPVSSR